MKQWRPENWKNPYHIDSFPLASEMSYPTTLRDLEGIYEVAADAMLASIVECLEDIVEFYECNGACDCSYHIKDNKKWLALLKEWK